MKRSIPMLFVLPILAACSGATGGKDSSDGPDFGSESAADTATHPATLVPITNGQVVTAQFDTGSEWNAFVFAGKKNESVSLFAQGGKDIDTVIYLYKVSATTGRPYGRAIASNDDTDDTSWTTNALDSNIASFTLPETRNYALLVTTYKQQGHGFAHAWFHPDAPSHSGTLPFPGSGPPAPVDFKDLHASLLPINPDVIATAESAKSADFYITPIRISAPSSELAATLADPARMSVFAYDVLYNAKAIFNGNNPHLTAVASPIHAASAQATLDTAVGRQWGSEQKQLDDADAAILRSMFADGGFADSGVSTFKLHWDNSDDTNAEGILAVDVASGEARALTFVVPP